MANKVTIIFLFGYIVPQVYSRAGGSGGSSSDGGFDIEGDEEDNAADRVYTDVNPNKANIDEMKEFIDVLLKFIMFLVLIFLVSWIYGKYQDYQQK